MCLGVVLFEALANNIDYDLVRNEFARIKEYFETVAFLRTSAERSAKDVTRGNMRDDVVARDSHTLRSLASSLFAENDQSRSVGHACARYLRKPS